MIRRTPIRRSSKAKEKELDDLVRQLVFARDNWTCIRCGGTSALDPFHILPKGKYPKLRWELLNVLCVCWPCHRHHWHDDPVGGVAWLERKLPGRMDTLRVLDRTASKPDLKELKIALELEVQELQR